MTYAELIAKLQTWWESGETAFVAEVDTFIEHAEKRIYRSVDLNVTKQKSSPALLTAGVSSDTVPSDLVILQAVYVSGVGYLLQKDYSFVIDYTISVASGAPRYYAWKNDTDIKIAPIVDSVAAYYITYEYTSRPTQLSSGNTTTWLSLNAPDVLFYACMLEVLTFQKAEADTIQDYTAKYQQALQGLVLEENLRNRTDEYREGEIKMGAPQ